MFLLVNTDHGFGGRIPQGRKGKFWFKTHLAEEQIWSKRTLLFLFVSLSPPTQITEKYFNSLFLANLFLKLDSFLQLPKTSSNIQVLEPFLGPGNRLPGDGVCKADTCWASHNPHVQGCREDKSCEFWGVKEQDEELPGLPGEVTRDSISGNIFLLSFSEAQEVSATLT